VLEKLALREASVGNVGTKRVLCYVALREACVGKVGTKRCWCWKKWH